MNGLVNVPFWDFEHFKNPSGDHISYIQSGDQDIVTCTNRYWREYCDSDDTQSISSGLNPKYENLSVQKKFVYKLPNFCTRMDQSGSLEEIGPKQFISTSSTSSSWNTGLLRHGARWCRWFPRRWHRVDRIWAPKSAGLGWLRSHGGWNFTMGILSTISRRCLKTTLGCSRFFFKVSDDHKANGFGDSLSDKAAGWTSNKIFCVNSLSIFLRAHITGLALPIQ